MCRDDGADLYPLGLIVAAIGLPFQVALLTSLCMMIGLSIIFVSLALSMFRGIYLTASQAHYKTKLSLLSQQKPVPWVEWFLLG